MITSTDSRFDSIVDAYADPRQLERIGGGDSYAIARRWLASKGARS